jgi:hypothetical protein
VGKTTTTKIECRGLGKSLIEDSSVRIWWEFKQGTQSPSKDQFNEAMYEDIEQMNLSLYSLPQEHALAATK